MASEKWEMSYYNHKHQTKYGNREHRLLIIISKSLCHKLSCLYFLANLLLSLTSSATATKEFPVHWPQALESSFTSTDFPSQSTTNQTSTPGDCTFRGHPEWCPLIPQRLRRLVQATTIFALVYCNHWLHQCQVPKIRNHTGYYFKHRVCLTHKLEGQWAKTGHWSNSDVSVGRAQELP